MIKAFTNTYTITKQAHNTLWCGQTLLQSLRIPFIFYMTEKVPDRTIFCGRMNRVI